MNDENKNSQFDKEIHPSYGIENYKLNFRACIPFYVLLDKDLSGNEKTLYGLIEQMEASKGIVIYKNETLCRILGVSKESGILKKMTKNLKEKGYIKRERIQIEIEGKLKKLWCWNTVKTNVIVEGCTSDTPKGGSSDTPPGGTSGTPSNTHDLKSHNSKTHNDAPADADAAGALQNPTTQQPNKVPELTKEVQQVIAVWNAYATSIGCPLVGNDKRRIKAIHRNIKAIKQSWDIDFTPDTFEIFLNQAIDNKYYLLVKFQKSLDIFLRWKHFEEAYQLISKEL